MKDVTFFATPADFRRWLKKHHRTAKELWVGFYKKASGRPSITWPESVDEALCFGWIDGVRKSIDAESYVIRFSPRRPNSIWSLVNLRRAEELIAEKRMTTAGLQMFEERNRDKSGLYSFERQEARLAPKEEALFRADRSAWSFFQAQPPGYRRTVIWWIVSAKREETRARRLRILMEDCAAGRRIAAMQK